MPMINLSQAFSNAGILGKVDERTGEVGRRTQEEGTIPGEISLLGEW